MLATARSVVTQRCIEGKFEVVGMLLGRSTSSRRRWPCWLYSLELWLRLSMMAALCWCFVKRFLLGTLEKRKQNYNICPTILGLQISSLRFVKILFETSL